MDINKLEKVIKLLKDNNLHEIEIEEKDSKIKVKSSADQQVVAPSYQTTPDVKVTAQKEEVEKTESKYKLILSPMVGTFYRSPAPESPLYVEEGQVINKGQILCLVEAMKLMNEIESEVDGIVARILVENNQPVEYGEPLFLIDPK